MLGALAACSPFGVCTDVWPSAPAARAFGGVFHRVAEPEAPVSDADRVGRPRGRAQRTWSRALNFRLAGRRPDRAAQRCARSRLARASAREAFTGIISARRTMRATRATLLDSPGMTTTSSSSRAWSCFAVPMRRPIAVESMKSHSERSTTTSECAAACSSACLELGRGADVMLAAHHHDGEPGRVMLYVDCPRQRRGRLGPCGSPTSLICSCSGEGLGLRRRKPAFDPDLPRSERSAASADEQHPPSDAHPTPSAHAPVKQVPDGSSRWRRPPWCRSRSCT